MGGVREQIKKTPSWVSLLFGIRQRPTLPGRLQPSTIGAERLNFCVRYGNRWDPFAIVTGILLGFFRTLKTAHPNFNHLALDQFYQFSLWSHLTLLNSLDQVLDRLVSASFIRYRTFTADLSPGSLPGVLLLSNGILLLEVGFTLRCLQRLSRPHFASQLCHWHDNCCTSDASTPVLSY